MDTEQIAITPSSCLEDPVYEDTCNLRCLTPGFEISPIGHKEVSCLANQTWTSDIGDSQCLGKINEPFEQIVQAKFASKNSG